MIAAARSDFLILIFLKTKAKMAMPTISNRFNFLIIKLSLAYLNVFSLCFSFCILVNYLISHITY